MWIGFGKNEQFAMTGAPVSIFQSGDYGKSGEQGTGGDWKICRAPGTL